MCAHVYTATEKQCASMVKMGAWESGCLDLPVASALTVLAILERLLLT